MTPAASSPTLIQGLWIAHHLHPLPHRVRPQGQEAEWALSSTCPEGFPTCVSLSGRGLGAAVPWQNAVGFLENSCRTTSKRCSDAKTSHLRSALLFITQSLTLRTSAAIAPGLPKCRAARPMGNADAGPAVASRAHASRLKVREAERVAGAARLKAKTRPPTQGASQGSPRELVWEPGISLEERGGCPSCLQG